MPNHQFIDFFFHPILPDTLVCIECEEKAEDIKSFHLEAIEAEKKLKSFDDRIDLTNFLQETKSQEESKMRPSISKRVSMSTSPELPQTKARKSIFADPGIGDLI